MLLAPVPAAGLALLWPGALAQAALASKLPKLHGFFCCFFFFFWGEREWPKSPGPLLCQKVMLALYEMPALIKIPGVMDVGWRGKAPPACPACRSPALPPLEMCRAAHSTRL